MSGDSLDRVARDLQTYLKQQQEAGMEWYLDEGAPAEAATVAKAPAAEAPITDKPAVPAPTPAPAAAPTPLPRPTVPEKPKPPEFEVVCERFVQETLAQIEQYRVQPDRPAAPDMFAEPEAVPDVLTPDQKAVVLAEMAAEVAACEGCKLHSTRNNTVFGAGSADAEVVFVGEAPGRHEDEQGVPFVGRAGKLLTDILKAIGFAREDIYICNILKCRPPKNRDPEKDEVAACEPFLKRQLEILQPKVICCLGRHAAMTLLDTRASLRNLREAVHFYEGIPVLATYHPAALLRNPHWKRDTWDDVRKLRALHDALVAQSSDDTAP